MIDAFRTILIRWLDLLAAIYVGWRDERRSRRVLVVSQDGQGLVVRRQGAGEGEVLASVEAGARVPEPVLAESRAGLVVLRLPPDKVLQERIVVPRQAREFLPGIVRNQIERLSPWKADQVAYGFDAAERRQDGTTLDVTLLMTSRAIMESARDEVAAAGLKVDRVEAVNDDDEPARSVDLWSAVADAPGEALSRARRTIGACVAGSILLSAAIGTWAFESGSAAGAESEELASRIKVLQRQDRGARTAASSVASGPLEQAWTAKEAAPSAAVVMEVLSRVLPETAYLTELEIQGTALRMTGLGTDAPALIAPLEASGHLADVRFFAPTTRTADGALSRFYIEARILPRLKVAAQ